MGIKDLMQKAMERGNQARFDVELHTALGDVELNDWTYLQLGLFLFSSVDNIEKVIVIVKPE